MKEIRVLLLNGSPRANGNTALALREMEKAFAQNGVQTDDQPVRSITPRPTRRSSPAWTACFTPRPLTRP